MFRDMITSLTTSIRFSKIGQTVSVSPYESALLVWLQYSGVIGTNTLSYLTFLFSFMSYDVNIKINIDFYNRYRELNCTAQIQTFIRLLKNRVYHQINYMI